MLQVRIVFKRAKLFDNEMRRIRVESIITKGMVVMGTGACIWNNCRPAASIAKHCESFARQKIARSMFAPPLTSGSRLATESARIPHMEHTEHTDNNNRNLLYVCSVIVYPYHAQPKRVNSLAGIGPAILFFRIHSFRFVEGKDACITVFMMYRVKCISMWDRGIELQFHTLFRC